MAKDGEKLPEEVQSALNRAKEIDPEKLRNGVAASCLIAAATMDPEKGVDPAGAHRVHQRVYGHIAPRKLSAFHEDPSSVGPEVLIHARERLKKST